MPKKKSSDKSLEKSKKKVLKEIRMSEESSKEAAVEPEKKQKSKNQKKIKKSTGKTRKLPVRIILFLTKTLFIRLPVLIIFIIFLALIVIKIFLSPHRVENLIITNFNNASNGIISLNVKEFNPYGGFVIENILIKNGDEFNKTKFLEMKKLELKYGLFSMFYGNIHFDKVGIIKPRIYLEEKNGVWNVQKLMKQKDKNKIPEKKKPEKKIEKKEKKKEEKVVKKEDTDSKVISLPISVQVLFKFILDDLRLYVNSTKFKSTVEGLTFNMDLNIPPFKEIPKSVEAVKLLKIMKIVLNPGEKMKVTYYSKDADLAPPLILTWNLNFLKENNVTKFNSFFKFGTYNTPVRFKKSYLSPLNFMISYDLFYNPIKDYLKLNNFSIEFHNKKWLALSGNVNNVTKNQTIDIRMTESDISLNALYPYFLSITKNRRMKFGGNLSLYPLTIKGTPSDIDIKGNIKLKKLYFLNPGIEFSTPLLDLFFSVNKKNNNMVIQSALNMPYFIYGLKGKKSGANGFSLQTSITAFNNFSRVNINNFSMYHFYPGTGKRSLDMALNGNVNLKPRLSGNIKINKFRFLKEPLIATVPRGLKKQLEGIPIKKPVDMNLGVSFALGKKISAKLRMLLKIPDYQLNDLRMNVNVVQDTVKKLVNLKNFRISSRSWNADIGARGIIELKKQPFSNVDMKLFVKLNNKKMKTMYGPWKFSGLIDLNTHAKGDLKNLLTTGSINIENFNLRNDDKKMLLQVDDFNLNFPFNYSLKKTSKSRSMIVVTKSNVIDNEIFDEKINFTIKSIKAKHPARNIKFEYLKDFSASMFFKDKVFQIQNMKAYVLDGALYGKSILFNLADGKTKNMEFNLNLDMTNIDISLLDEPNPVKKNEDALLSLSANFSGRGLDIKKEFTPKGYINIHKIGEEFANKLMTGLSKEKGKSKLGVIGQFAMDNSMTVSGFNFNLDKGLVYATVTLSRGAVGYLIGVENNRINFDRITIQEYLRKVRKGD